MTNYMTLTICVNTCYKKPMSMSILAPCMTILQPDDILSASTSRRNAPDWQKVCAE